jgi:hypothetical protein
MQKLKLLRLLQPRLSFAASSANLQRHFSTAKFQASPVLLSEQSLKSGSGFTDFASASSAPLSIVQRPKRTQIDFMCRGAFPLD